MKKNIIILFVEIVLTTTVFSQRQQVSHREAKEAATNWIRVHFPEYQSRNNVDSLTSQRGNMLLYEIRFDSINVLLSGSRACLPVLGYYKGNVSITNNMDNIPCNLKSLISSYIKEIEGCFANDTIRLYHNDDWTNLIEGNSLREERITEVVPPLIKTKWNQSWSNDSCDLTAYNYYIPPDESHYCLHQLVGCGAVALAQVMNYWQYPLLYQAPQQFDWCNMTDSLNRCSDNNYEKHRDAIAYMMYRCAEDIDSEYGCERTTSYLRDIKNILVNQYGYSNSSSIVRWNPNTVNIDVWSLPLKGNLDNKHPVLYFGTGAEDGHFFLLDGYNSDGWFHINWGWMGRCDGYYTLNDLTPGVNDYNSSQAAIINIVPGSNSSICNADLYLDDFYHDNASMLNDYHPYEITPQTMTTLTSASSTSDASWRTIPTGATAIYQAHEKITLQDGFEAEYGSEFEARIEPCEQCDEMRGAEPSENDDFIANNRSSANEDNDEVLYSTGSPAPVVDLDLFPNPTDGPLTMHTDGEPQKVLIYTLDGRLVGGWHLTALGDDFVSLDVSSLRPGPYLLSVVTATSTRTARFIRH